MSYSTSRSSLNDWLVYALQAIYLCQDLWVKITPAIFGWTLKRLEQEIQQFVVLFTAPVCMSRTMHVVSAEARGNLVKVLLL